MASTQTRGTRPIATADASHSPNVIQRSGYLAAIVLALVGDAGCGESRKAPAAGESLIVNGGFEQWDGQVPQGWILEDRVRSKGNAVSSREAAEGKKSLKLAPNAKNNDPGLPLAVGQAWPAGQLRGKRLRAEAWLGATKPAKASFGVFAVKKDGQIAHSLVLESDSAEAKLTRKEGVFQVPATKDFELVIARCSVATTEGAALFDGVRLTVDDSVGPTPDGKSATEAALPLVAAIQVDPDHGIRSIPRTLYGTNIDWCHDAKGLWNARRGALDPDVVRLTAELGVSLLRFPGGALSDFYHWRDGVGPQKNRPTTHQTGPSSDKSRHSFGTDEALEFARLVNAQLLITVNAGSGAANEAAEWVRYVRRRHENGAPPVVYWEVGNELYIKDDNPTTNVTNVSVTPEEYARRFLEFAKAMRAADPTIKVGGIGGQNYGRYRQNSYEDWNSKVLRIAGPEMNFFAVHNAYAPLVIDHRSVTLRQVYEAMLAAPLLIRKNLETVSRQIRSLSPKNADQLRIAVTEWGPFFHTQPESPYVDHVKTLGSALYVASAMNAFLDSPQTDIANFYKLVEPVFMGWIGKRGNQWIANAPYLALQLYTHYFGEQLIACRVESPTYDAPAVGFVDQVANVPFLEAVASKDTAGRTLYLMVVNKHFDRPIRANISLGGRSVRSGTARTLRGTGIDANRGSRPLEVPGIRWARQAADPLRPRFELGGPDEVSIVAKEFKVGEGRFDYTFPPHSVTSLELPLVQP